MQKDRRIMTFRTFGFIITVALLAVAAFSASLLLDQSNRATAERDNKPASTDTREIDRSRLAASGESTALPAASASPRSSSPVVTPIQPVTEEKPQQPVSEPSARSQTSSSQNEAGEQPRAQNDQPSQSSNNDSGSRSILRTLLSAINL